MGVRVTQEVIEAIETRSPIARTTQVVVEAIETRTPTARVTQVVIETIRSTRTPTDYPITVADTVSVTSAPTGRSSFINVTVGHALLVTPAAGIVATVPDIFTGMLGITLAELGTFVLGLGRPSSTVRTTVESTVHVGQDITADVDANPHHMYVAHSIGVQSSVSTENSLNKVVSHSVTVGQTTSVNRDLQRGITTSVVVAQTITPRNTVTRLTVSSPVAVSEVITTRGPVRQTVAQSIGVVPFIIVRGRDVPITVSHSISTAPLITFRNTVVRISVISSIGASVGDVEHNTVNRQTIGETVHVDSLSSGHNDRMIVVDNVLITSTATARSTVVRRQVAQQVTVSELIIAMNPRITVAQSIGVSQTISARSNIIRKTVADSIHVGEQIVTSKAFVEILVEDTINIPQSFLDSWPATARVDPVRSRIFDTVTVTCEIFGGNSNRAITVSDLIEVKSSPRSSWQFQTVNSTVHVEPTIVNGRSNREITINDNVLVTSTVSGRKTPISITVNDTLIVTTVRTARGPNVEILVDQAIHVVSKVSQRISPVIHMNDTVHVEPVIRANPNKQTVAHSVQVDQFARSTPININVNQTVHISERSSDIYMIMRDVINVGSKFWNQQDVHLTDTLPIEQTLSRQVERNRHLVQELPIVQSLNRFMIWTQNLTDTLIFPETSFQKQFSFWPDPIDVPVFHGGLMSNVVVLECENDAITLPAALLGDTLSNVDKIIVQRSMNAKTLTIISSSDRQKMTLKFRISLIKSYELRRFVMAHQSGMINLTDWNGAIWKGRFMSNPFNHTHTGRSATEQEYVNFDIEFEGVKIAG